MIPDIITTALFVVSAFFFTAGTLGLLRFPDTLARLHALTKADNLGMGCLVVGLLLQADTLTTAIKLGLIWSLTMFVGASTSYLIARHTLHRQPQRNRQAAAPLSPPPDARDTIDGANGPSGDRP